MAFKFILGHHIKSILNDAEEKQKKDIKEYAGGHLNESVLLKAPLVLNRRPWASAKDGPLKLTKASKPVHKPRDTKGENRSAKETLFDFSLGTTGAIPPVKAKLPRTPKQRYRLVTEEEKAAEAKAAEERNAQLSAKSLYSQLEDGVLVEELPTQELMMPSLKSSKLPKLPTSREKSLDSEKDEAAMGQSQSTMETQRSDGTSPFQFSYSVLPMQSKGITKKDQYRKLKAFDANVLQKKEMAEQNVLSGTKAARHHEQKLQQDLHDLNLNGIGPNFHRLQVFSNILEDVIEDSPTFNYILGTIKTEYDNYIAQLLDGQTSQQHLLRDQVDQMASRGTSRPGEMASASQRLLGLENEAKNALDANKKLKEDLTRERDILNKTPEVPVNRLQPFKVKKTPPIGSTSRKEQPVELSLELENMKALILEKLDELNDLRQQVREEYVPMTVCTHLEQCIKETEVEVQKLLKQNEYFERSIAEMDTDLKEAIVDADTSEKDARRIWHKVNSCRGMPGTKPSSRDDSDDDDDDESKWNWYIS